jgi:poly-gamma-glutamate synthesis protein (capsule biosynthesis protein)
MRTLRLALAFVAVVALALAASWRSAGRDDGDSAVVGIEPDPTATEAENPEPTAEPTAPPTPEPTPSPAAPETVTVAFTGEILSHSPVFRQAAAYATGDQSYDYGPMFAEISPLLEAADLAICHLETPVSPDNTALSGYPVFNAPKELPVGLAGAGYDACSTASNHSLDRGASGVISTLDELEAAGLEWAGMARTAEEKATPSLYDVGGITIGHLSYSYGLNGYVMPADQPYLVNVTDVDAVLAEAAAAKEAGADFVVLSIQWGNEYQVNPSLVQLEQAPVFLGSPDIDLIVGAHVHVVQPIGMVDDEYVVYGLGNSLSNQSSAAGLPAATQNGIMVFVDITGTDADGYSVSDISFVPTRVDRTDYTIVPLPVALADPDLDPGTRSLYEDVVESTSEVVNRLGVGVKITDFEALVAAS